jgi:hypothetical protein
MAAAVCSSFFRMPTCLRANWVDVAAMLHVSTDLYETELCICCAWCASASKDPHASERQLLFSSLTSEGRLTQIFQRHTHIDVQTNM